MVMKLVICCLVQLIFVMSVEGVSMNINPNSMVIGSSTAGPVATLQLRCSEAGTTDVKTIFQLQISRRKWGNGESTFSAVASISIGDTAAAAPNPPSDLLGITVTGNIDIQNPATGNVAVNISGQGLTCTDAAEFECMMNYLPNTGASIIVRDFVNFTVITAPNDIQVPYNFAQYYGANGALEALLNNSEHAAGTRITFQCTANIGSDSSTDITWERSPIFSTSPGFIPYTPTIPTDITQGVSEPNQVQNPCYYTRTSTMYYNLSNSDTDGISFRCKVRAYLNNQFYEAVSMERRTIAVSTAGGGNIGPAAGGTVNTASAGIIAGAVVGGLAAVVLVIVLVYFLWYRRRGDGESYRTKEDDERRERPPSDYTYSVPDKKKNAGHENKGLDEPHETRRYPKDGRGHYNPSMDDEDGTDHNALHMSHGPIGTGV